MSATIRQHQGAAPPPGTVPGQVLPWLGRGAAAFVDQLLTSGSNFLGSVLLARWLSASEYGAYALAFSVFLLLSSIHGSFVIDPMPVFGPSVYRRCRQAYLGLLLRIHAGLSIAFVMVLAAATLIVH